MGANGWSDQGPNPGDPRDSGPRPPARARDVAWLLLAIALIALTAAQTVNLVISLVRLDGQASGGGLFLGFVITVVWFLAIYWLAMGAWRRSVWGCPFQHTESATPARRCPRHRLVTQGPSDARSADAGSHDAASMS